MPLIDLNGPSLSAPNGGVPDPTPDEEAAAQVNQPNMSQIVGAAFRQSNSFVSQVSSEKYNLTNDVDPDFNAWNAIKGTKYESNWDAFTDVRNQRDLQARQAQVDSENADKQTLAQSGWLGTVASVGAGFTDPTMLIPIAGEVSAARDALTIGKAAVKTGLSVGAASAVQEGLSNQKTLSGEDAASAIGSSIILGGLLGGGIHALLPSERAAGVAALDHLRSANAPSAGEAIARDSSAISGAPSFLGSGASDAGAAASENFSRGDLSVNGAAANAVVGASSELNPTLRLNTSPSIEARVTGQRLGENSIYQNMHTDGGSLGPAAETLMRQTMDARLSDAIATHNQIYSDATKGGMKMSRGDFENAIGQAMRRGDVGENPAVTQAAQAWRQKVFEPFKQEAIDHGLLPADVDVSTADSYFRRIWDQQKLTGNEGAFKDTVSNYYAGSLKKEYGDDVDRLQGRMSKIEQEKADLNLSPDARQSTLDTIKAEQDQHFGNAPQHVDRADQVNELRQQAADARQKGDMKTAKAAKEQAATLHAAGGDEYKAWLAKRSELNARQKNVGLGYASIADKQSRIMDSLADISESNSRSMQRLIKKGQIFQQTLQKLDPEKLADKVSDLRESFASQAAKVDKQVERLKRAKEALNSADDAASHSAASADLDKQIAAQQATADKLHSISARLEAAESMDPQAMIDEVGSGVGKLADDTSNLSLERGEKAQRLQERLQKLDPKKIDDRLQALDQMKRDHERAFYDKWEIERGAQGIDASGKGTPDFSEYSRDIAHAVYDKLTGRGLDNNIPEGLVPATRGPLKERTFNIPDKHVEPFLHDNIMEVAHDYARKMAGEIELTRRFGSADLKTPLGKIQDEYRGLREQVTNAQSIEEMRAVADRNPGAVKGLFEKAKAPDIEDVRRGLLKYLAKSEKSDTTDIQAMRDLLRGTYKPANVSNVWTKAARGLTAYNFITRMGSASLSHLTQVFRPAMVYGMKSFLGDGIAPLLSSAGRAAVGMSAKEAKLAGLLVERTLQHRVSSLAEMGDPFGRGTAMGRLLENGTRVASRWTGLPFLLDNIKTVSGVLAQNRILEAMVNGGEERTLAYLGFDPALRARAAEQVKQFSTQEHGVWVANTEKWTDPEAVRTFRAAMAKDVNSVITTKSVGDLPLFASTPTGKVLIQFKSFALAGHQRTLIRGLQESPTRFMSGMVGMTALGMLSTYLRAIATNRLDKIPGAEDPGYWIGEGLDKSGIFAVPMELANDLEKPTGVNLVKDPLHAASGALFGATEKKESFANTNRNAVGSLLGPSAGMAGDVFNLLGTLTSHARGAKVSPGQDKSAVTSAANLTPYYSYPILRQIIDWGIKPGINNAIGAK